MVVIRHVKTDFERNCISFLYMMVCLLAYAGSEATLESLITMLEAIGCFEGAEICRKQGMYTQSPRTTC